VDISSIGYVFEYSYGQNVAGGAKIRLEHLNKFSINKTRAAVVIIKYQISVVDVLECSSKGFTMSSLPMLVLWHVAQLARIWSLEDVDMAFFVPYVMK
jgi:hypothetical protein